MERKLYIKVGDEAVRGPLGEDAVRASLASGVLPASTLAGESADALRPLQEVLAARPANSGTSGAGARIALGVGALLAILGIGGGVAYYVKTRPPPLCKATPNVLARIQADKQVKITLFVTPSKTKRIAAARRNVEGLLARMRTDGQGKLAVEVVEVRDEDGSKRALEAGLQTAVFTDGDKDEASIRPGFFGLVFAYGSEQDKIAILTPESDVPTMEYFIVNRVREIVARGDKRSQRIAVVAGHGGVQIGDQNLVPPTGGGGAAGGPTIRGIIEQYFPYYRLEDANLKTGGVAPEALGVLVTQPDLPFDDAELAKIDEHVMRGGSLAIIASAAHAALGDAALDVKVATRGLEKLTNGYGLELGLDLVYDTKDRFEVRVDTSSGNKPMGFEWIPIVEEGAGLDSKSVPFFRLPQAPFPLASSITLHEDRQPDATFRVLARTSADGVRDTHETIRVGLVRPGVREGERGSFILAASVEGTLTSAFGKGKSAKPARVLVIASSAFLANPFVRAGTPPGGDELALQLAGPYVQTVGTDVILTVKNIFDWLAWEDDLAGCLLPAGHEASKK